MSSEAQGRVFVIVPFGRKQAATGTMIDFDRVYYDYLKPAIEAAGLRPSRADAERRGGSIHSDMFQELLLAEFVVADLTIDNPNVWYEIGVRHALRASGTVLTYAQREKLPFDLAGQRMMPFTIAGDRPDPETVGEERAALAEAIRATLGAWRGRKGSPVYATLPNLREPDWKTLQVGDVNEFWDALKAWQSRVEVARRKQRPGDILVLVEETPTRVLAFEGLRTAAKALLDLQRPRYALAVLDRALALDPGDLRCRQHKGVALGRIGRFEEAREVLQALADANQDGETLGLLARTWKDQWIRLWRADPAHAASPCLAARSTAATLAKACEAYGDAFRADPANAYPGINALSLGRMWEHVTGRKSRTDLTLIAAGVRWAAACALARRPDCWSLATRAELELLEGGRDAALDDYAEAAALAVAGGDGFALDSISQTLDCFRKLEYRAELTAAAATVIDNAERQLKPEAFVNGTGMQEPAHVILFSGHMVDRPGREPPRFPEEKAAAAAQRIARELAAIGAGRGDLGIAQAASGGDLLFAQACLAAGMRLEIYLPQREAEFIAGSVAFAAPHWQRDYDALKDSRDVTFRVMPDELGPTPDGTGLYDRCNLWMLHSALSCGLAKVGYITLWNGQPGDGPGGTDHMVELVRRLSGRSPVVIDPADL